MRTTLNGSPFISYNSEKMPYQRLLRSLGGPQPFRVHVNPDHLTSRSFVNRVFLAAGLFSLATCTPHQVRRQPESQPVAWLDPRTNSNEALVYRTWQAYLESKHGDLAANAGTPSALWDSTEQAKWPMYDLAGLYAPPESKPDVQSIRLDRSSGRVEYELVIRFRARNADSLNSAAPPLLTMTVYAVQERHRWVLANALPRRTRNWERRTVGQITYVVEPALRFDSTRARRAVSFVDSLAAALEVPRLGPLDYYVTSSVDVALNILGVAFPARYGSSGGFSKPVNQQLFSGIPALGEDYRHELVHLVVRPLLRGSTMTILATEGMATWLGGTAGLSFPATVRRFATYLMAHPEVTLDTIVGLGFSPQEQSYPAGAVLCAMVFEHGGTEALKAFLLAGPRYGDLRSALERLLGEPWVRIVADWRAMVTRLAAASGGSA